MNTILIGKKTKQYNGCLLLACSLSPSFSFGPAVVKVCAPLVKTLFFKLSNLQIRKMFHGLSSKNCLSIFYKSREIENWKRWKRGNEILEDLKCEDVYHVNVFMVYLKKKLYVTDAKSLCVHVFNFLFAHCSTNFLKISTQPPPRVRLCLNKREAAEPPQEGIRARAWEKEGMSRVQREGRGRKRWDGWRQVEGES